MPVQNERNININPRDYAKLGMQGQPGVTGGQSGLPGILGILAAKQSGTGSQPFKPKNTLADFMDMSPTVVPGVSSQEYLDKYGGNGNNQPKMPEINNPAQSIMEQLQQLLSGGGQFQPTSLPAFNPDQFKQQAERSVGEQYNPIIQEILNQQKTTQARAGTNKAAVAGLYNEAVGNIQAGSKQTQGAYDATQAESKKLYTDERSRIAAGYAADAAAQKAETKKLGTEALGDNGAGAQATADRQFSDQMGSQQMQSSQNALGQQQAAAGQYDQAITNATRAEGVAGQQDIMRQLEDYMSQSNSNLADTRSQEAGSVNDLMMKLASAANDRNTNNAQFQYQQQRDYIGDQTNLAKMMMDAQQAGASTTADKLNPWQSTAMFADQLRPGQGQDIVAAIQKAMNDRPEIYARAQNDPVKMNPALFAKLVADDPGNQGMDRNSLMQVAQELYRQLYGM